MATLFNSDEVFAIAVQIEKNGAEFYRAVSGNQTDPEKKAYLDKLALMEDEHVRIFSEMRSEMAGDAQSSETTDLYNEGGLFLASIAGGYPVEGAPSVADSLTGNETMEEILNIAIDLEKKSILFYLGLKDVVPENLGRDKVDGIIAEEKSHVVSLVNELKKLKS